MLELMDAIEKRHSVRNFTDRPLEGETARALQEWVDQCSYESGLHLQLVTNEPEAFSGMMARYGSFHNVRNYLVLAGVPGKGFEERCGYYGEKILLRAVQLGLCGCWAAMTYSKKHCAAWLAPGEKLCCVIALGYGMTEGVSHRSKPLEKLYRTKERAPAWFMRGVQAAQLAPTAMNRQQFMLSLEDGEVRARALPGPYAKIDLGIVKYHFEAAAGREGWRWS